MYVCQTIKNEKLICPRESKNQNGENKTFETIKEDLRRFEAAGYSEMSVDKFIENGQTFRETCINNNGKYHKICRNKYDKHHFERFKKKHETTVEEEEIISETPRKLTRSSFDSINFQVWCIFCNKSDGSLRRARSFAIDNRVRQAANLLGDNKLIAQLSEGDMHAIEARYHPGCLCKYCSRALQLEKQYQETYQNSVTYDIVMTEVINFMKKSNKKHDSAPVFVLSELKKMFKTAYQR